VAKSAQNLVDTLVLSIFAPPDAKEVWTQHGRVVEQLEKRFNEAAKMLAEAVEETSRLSPLFPSPCGAAGVVQQPPGAA
jgi:hypothetical protein